MSERTKWAVLPGWCDTCLEEGWFALAPHMILPERDEDSRLDYCHLERWDHDGGQWFPTWAEAMRYADEQARTITVTLPRLAPEEWTTVGNFRVIPEPPWRGDALEVDELDADGAYFIIGREDCEPLALALLAHARGRA